MKNRFLILLLLACILGLASCGAEQAPTEEVDPPETVQPEEDPAETVPPAQPEEDPAPGLPPLEGTPLTAEELARANEAFNSYASGSEKAMELGCFFTSFYEDVTELDFEEFLTTLGSRLKVLHIHDNDGLADLHQIPFVFTRTRENKSSTDWEGFVRGLRAIGFDGVLNFETAPVLTAFPEELREDALRLIARIGRYLGGQISGGDR